MNAGEPSPAFPFAYVDKSTEGVNHSIVSEGMSLRDYFAARFAQAQIGFEGMEGCDKAHIAAMSYELADAMIAERKR